MVGGENMDGPKRDYVLKLMDKKNKYENELRHHHEILKINNIGMHEPLVDAQGYPRNDIDVYQVRHARHKIIILQNDLRRLMKLIEKGVADAYADFLARENDLRHIMKLIEKGVADAHADFIGTPASRRSEAGSKVPADGHADSGPRKPFAVVTRVDHGSPADSCGLCADDKIIQFGSLNCENFKDVSQIMNIVMSSVGQPISLQVKRARHWVNVTLVPKPWGSPGLLGCHIQKINLDTP